MDAIEDEIKIFKKKIKFVLSEIRAEIDEILLIGLPLFLFLFCVYRILIRFDVNAFSFFAAETYINM